jgi:parallel beta-helix repeat protein
MDRDIATSRFVLALLILVIVMLAFVVSAGNDVISGISDPDAVGLEATYKSEDLGVTTTEKLLDAEESTREGDTELYSNITAGSSVTCTSCEDCTRKLNNGFYDTVILSQNILNHTGDCITLSADNVVFDCSGYFISGDLPAAPFNVDYGIKVTGDNNVITNCNVGLFWYGIWLDSANFTTITRNNLALNGYAGLTLANSDNNNITANTLNFNSYGLAILNSHNTEINSNAACANLIADIWQENSGGNAGTNNTCYNTHNWNDTGTVDCTHLCCLVPSDDMRIEKDTKFCPGWYNITDSGAQGAIIINASNIVLDGNGATIRGSGAGYGIYNPGFDNVTITNVTVLNYGTGIQLVESDNNIISTNNVTYSATKGIAVEDSQQCVIYGNRVSYSGERGIAFSGGGDNAAYNNVAYNNSAFGAIEAVFSDNNEIYNNTAYFNQWGIATNHGSYNQIHNNTMYGNELGIHLDWPSTDNRVVNNNISSNHAGIWTNHNSTDNIISGNLIVANEAAGIGIETNNNTIINNTAHHNRVGLYLGADTTGNTITHNSFCNNIVFDIRDDNNNSGDENTCNTQNGWDDAGTTGCTYPCFSGVSDLIITDIWFEGEFIWYQVRNIGNDTAPEGHWTGLLVDEVYVVNEQVAVALAPGERYNGFFGYSWCCTGGEDVIAVVADYNHHVPEANETNNRREEVWKCDTTPPRITAGPTVSEITQTSALVTWETDEASTSTVHYGNTARFYPFGQTDATLVQEHELVLTDLEPSTTYNVVVLSTDNGSNTVQSDDITFETAPLPDTEDPVVTLIDPGVCRGVVNLHATATDNVGVDKVEFYIDDHLIFTDFVPPYSAFFDSSTSANGLHELAVKALDHRGRSSRIERTVNVHNFIDVTAPQVKITAPTPWENVSGTVSINASLSDDAGLVEAFLFIDIENFVRGHKSWKQPYPTNATLSFEWDTTKFENGNHVIGIEAWDNSKKKNFSTVSVEVYNELPPYLDITSQKVTRQGNTFIVELTLTNTGDGVARNITIKDVLYGFQPISYHDQIADYNARNHDDFMECEIISSVTIAPGNSQTYSYEIVPVLDYPATPTPSIGDFIKLTYEGSDGTIYSDIVEYWVPYTTNGETIPEAHLNATRSADYLLVTSPHNLRLWYNPQDVDALLSTMADLAALENGVLGYLHGPAASFPRDYEQHDGFAVGDVHGGLYFPSEEEIVIADLDRDWIYIYDARGNPLYFSKNWIQQTGFAPGLDAAGNPEQKLDVGDRIAVGEVDWNVKEEIVLADCDDWIVIYDWQGNLLRQFPCDFDKFDGLAVGNVDGVGDDEIVILGESDEFVGPNNWWSNKTIYVYNSSGFLLSNFSLHFDDSIDFLTYIPPNGLAIGDVLGDTKEEIVIVEDFTNTVSVYEYTSNVPLASFTYNFHEGDTIAIGNVVWGGKEEIVIADHTTDRISIFQGDGYEYKSESLKREGIAQFDGLALGQVIGDPTNVNEPVEILVADQMDDSIDIYEHGQKIKEKYVLHDLIKQGGEWSNKLRSDWTSNGYLLIVGETEIIPAWGGKYWTKSFMGFTYDFLETDCTDYPYASTVGTEIIPELSMGRIIGNNAQLLRIPIETSINVTKGVPGYGFDRSTYLGMSGYPACLGEGTKPKGNCDYIEFWKEVGRDCQILHDKGLLGYWLNTPDFTVYNVTGYVNVTATEARIEDIFFNNTPDEDVLFLAGHGSQDGCDEIQRDDVLSRNIPFGTTNPFVFASSCKTGRYPVTTSLAEAFLQQGAGVYLGATESGRCCAHSFTSAIFFELWDTGESVGLAVRKTKGVVGHMDAYQKFWCAIYQVYGDPKFGWQGPMTATSGPSAALMPVQEAPPAIIEVTIPDYTVTSANGSDTVTIPGGSVLFEPGFPLVPFYQVFYEYPKGYQIQDVVLTNRSGVVTATNLNLSTAVIGIPGCCNALFEQQSGENPDLWPLKTFEWTVFDSPNSSTLALKLYPFYYNTLTTDARFFTEYQFATTYTVSNVTITALKTDKPVYALGDAVEVGVRFNDGEQGEIPPVGKDIVLTAVVIEENTNDAIAGLLLRTLSNFTGNATYTTWWNSSGFAPGYYQIQVELRDTEGLLLDQEVSTFRLGIAAGEIADFSVTPEHFEIGDEITINMTFANTGTVNLTGTAIVRVINRAGDAVEEYGYNVTDLLPSGSISFHDTWNTTGAAEGVYSILGYVLYEGMSTDPVSVMVGTETGGLDTGPGIYPSIAGTHNGTITLNQTMLVRRLYTYPCNGTGGHVEYVRIWNGPVTIAEESWTDYQGDWQNITFSNPCILYADETYNYTIRTGSYPQIIHEPSWNATGGVITCEEFVDVNGNQHEEWIPAIRLE